MIPAVVEMANLRGKLMLTLETKDDLETLHKNQVQESSTLEDKASPAVDNADPRRQEIAKDVSAMTNADGGQIVYGMTEKFRQTMIELQAVCGGGPSTPPVRRRNRVRTSRQNRNLEK